MTDTLEPIHTIPLGPTLTGEVAQAELQFAVENGKPVLYAAVPVWNATWGRWFAWHAPEIMVGVWLVVLIVLVRRLLHVRRTPREAGRRYCRRCNHQLTKPQLAFDERGRVQWASAEAKCPECGRRTRRVRVRGRSGWVRRLPWIVVALPMLLLIPALVALSLKRFTTVAGVSSPTWPIANLERLLGPLALSRVQSPTAAQSRCYLRLDPVSGEATTYWPEPPTSTFSYGPFVSPGGQRIAAGSFDYGSIVVIDTRSGHSKSLPRSPASRSSGIAQMLAFESDSSAIIQREWFADGAENLWLERVNLVEGTFETITHLVVPREQAMYPNSNRFDVVIEEGRLSWLLQTSGWRASAGQHNEVRWKIGNEIRMVDLTIPKASFNEQARLSVDGTAVLITNGANGQRALDYATGQPIENPPDALLSYPRAHPTLDFIYVSNTQMQVVDNESGRPVCLLPDVGPGATLMIPTISPSDRFVAMSAVRRVPSRWHQILTGKPTRIEGEIRIFRIPDPPAK